MNDTRADGLIQAHNIVSKVANSLPRVRWWQLGRKKYYQMAALCEVSQLIFDEVQVIYDERMKKMAKPE